MSLSIHLPLFTFRKEVYLTICLCFLHVFTYTMILPERPHVRRVEVALVVVSHHLLYCCRSFGGVVEWDTGYVVMHNVRFDCAVEEDSADEAKVSVHSRGCPSQEGPSLVGVVRNGNICVLQICYGHC